jgi:hypothetical protein
MGQKSNPPPAPFLFYLISRKTKSPKTAEISRPFQGFSLKTKGYVEKCLLPITFLFSGKNFFLKVKPPSVRSLSPTSHLIQTLIANKLQRNMKNPETLVPQLCPTRNAGFIRGTMSLSVPPDRKQRVRMSVNAWYRKSYRSKAIYKKYQM